MKSQVEFLAPFLSEAVEDSRCYFFEKWLMKLKCPNLLKPLGTLIQENYRSFYPSEPLRIPRFNMRHPVVVECPFIMFGIGGHTFYLLHVYRPFYKSGRGAPMILPSSCTSCSKKLSIGTVCFYVRIGSFIILKEIKVSPHILYRKVRTFWETHKI